MTAKASTPPRPRISGYCNPTLPSTAAYNPHDRCRGCDCTCHRPPPPQESPVTTTNDQPAPTGPDTPEATLGAAVSNAALAALQVSWASGQTTLEGAPLTDLLRALAGVREAVTTLRQVDSLIERAVYLRGEHGKRVVDGIGEVSVFRTRAREKWDERGVARAVVDARMEQVDGEVQDPWDVAEWLLEVLAVSYVRKTALDALGIPREPFYDSEPGVPRVTLPPRPGR